MAAEVPAGARGVQFLPYLTSAETPFWDADARGAFVGLSDTHGVPEMFRAVLEGLALEERLSLKRVEKATGTPVERLVVMGGGTKSPLFNQILADALQRPIEVCEPETTCLGAAILGAAAVGADGISGVSEAAQRMSRVSHTVEPQPHLDNVYKTAAKAHRALYPALRKVFPTIAKLRSLG